MRLGDHRTAAAYLQAAVDGTARLPREAVAWRIRLAQNQIQANDIAGGCVVLVKDFDAITTVASTRLRTAVGRIVEDLRPYSTIREAGELLGMWMAR